VLDTRGAIIYLICPVAVQKFCLYKNASRRTKNLKAALGKQRERERPERGKMRAQREEAMEVDGTAVTEDDMPSCG
jgi:hypothetical protein